MNEQVIQQRVSEALVPVSSIPGVEHWNREIAAQASSALSQVVEIRKAVKAEFEPVIKKAREALEAAREMFRRYDEPLENAERTLRESIASYGELERRRAEEEARRAAEEARRVIEERTEALLDSIGPEEKELAKAICEEAEREIRAISNLEPTRPKVNGVSMREEWRAVLVDMRSLCSAIGAGRAPVSLVELRQQEANRLAASYRESLSTVIPGLEAQKRTVVAVKPARRG